jgi:hypothetical protein
MKLPEEDSNLHMGLLVTVVPPVDSMSFGGDGCQPQLAKQEPTGGRLRKPFAPKGFTALWRCKPGWAQPRCLD